MKISTAQRNATVDARKTAYDDGYIRIYSGTQPADPQTALAGNTLLAELRFAATAFGATANGQASSNAIASEDAAPGTGTATFARLLESDGSTVIGDATVAASGADINLTGGPSIAAGQPVSLSGITITQPEES